MSNAANRLDWVDAAKGLSIILVVMMHSAYGVGEDLNGTGVLHYIIGWATPFRMPEFFLISGLFLGAVIARPWVAYADRRIPAGFIHLPYLPSMVASHGLEEPSMDLSMIVRATELALGRALAD